MASESNRSGAVESVLSQTSVIVALKDDRRVLRMLESVDENVEVVVVLNGTPPELERELASHASRPVVTAIPEVGNLGAAYNQGASVARGRYLLLMDSDCTFDPGTIRRMAGAATAHPVVKGRVLYGESLGYLSRLTARLREFDEAEFVSAQSPPLIYDARIAAVIGGYHYDPLIRWCEDREFDFRLQLAEIPVIEVPDATIRHDPQPGLTNLRSYWRYGLGEGVGQQTGVFTTPAVPVLWRASDALRSVAQCARSKGLPTALFYGLHLLVFHLATLYQVLRDPHGVRARMPSGAARMRSWRPIRQHGTELTAHQRATLRRSHRRRGVLIEPVPDLQLALAETGSASLEG
jgi:hypothetical protein